MCWPTISMRIDQPVMYAAMQVGTRVDKCTRVGFQHPKNGIMRGILGIVPVTATPRPRADQLAIVGKPTVL